jgi:hypothetical protein
VACGGGGWGIGRKNWGKWTAWRPRRKWQDYI